MGWLVPSIYLKSKCDMWAPPLYLCGQKDQQRHISYFGSSEVTYLQLVQHSLTCTLVRLFLESALEKKIKQNPIIEVCKLPVVHTFLFTCFLICFKRDKFLSIPFCITNYQTTLSLTGIQYWLLTQIKYYHRFKDQMRISSFDFVLICMCTFHFNKPETYIIKPFA